VALDSARVVEDPFRHWVIEDAISRDTLVAINREWPADDDPRWRKEDGKHQRKWSMPAEGEALRLVQELTSPAFCEQMAELLGVDELEGDPR
jgi:hypothetical protein